MPQEQKSPEDDMESALAIVQAGVDGHQAGAERTVTTGSEVIRTPLPSEPPPPPAPTPQPPPPKPTGVLRHP